ncbi:MAG: hypothetical protein RIB45_00365 [Marivibrio sp.]|uniref:hypothetical protein n=1 Tax=Marivibrio sp. TaxID=2039719 RepID=UPI0032EE91BB
MRGGPLQSGACAALRALRAGGMLAGMNEGDEQRGGGYVGGTILTVLFFLLVAALAAVAVIGIGFAAIAMPITTTLILLFFAVAGIAAWRAKIRHERALRRARAALEEESGH